MQDMQRQSRKLWLRSGKRLSVYILSSLLCLFLLRFEDCGRSKQIMLNVNVNVIVVLNANVLRLDEDRRQRRSGISIWT